MNDKTLAAEPEPAARQFQGRDGVWHNFIDERHFQNTVANGSWPIRNLYTQEAIDTLRAQLAEAQGDAERLDWIEAQVNKNGELHLHDGNHARGIGIGLRPGALVRTLRSAIDAAKGPA